MDSVWRHAEELEAYLGDVGAVASGGRVHVVWLEAFGLRVAPRLMHKFHEYSDVEVIHQPHFGMHIEDRHVLAEMPSLVRLKCAGAVACWWLDLEDVPPGHAGAAAGGGGSGLPAEAGCWFRLPSGCPSEESLHRQGPRWLRDSWGEREFNSLGDSDACLRRRREAFNAWCGVRDAETHFVPASAPAPGGPRRRPALRDALRAAASAAARAAAAAAGAPSPGPAAADAPPPPQGVRGFEARCAAVVEGCAPPGPPPGAASGAVPLAPPAGWAPYLRAHAAGGPAAGAVVWACHPSFPCGGHGDRVKGIVAVFILALLTGRHFYVDAPDPWDLRLFLEPHHLDWRVQGLHGVASGRHVLWDHDFFEKAYLDHLLADDAPVWVLYTNKQSLIGPMLRHPRLAGRAEALGLFGTPFLVRRIWDALFRPTAAMERHVGRVLARLGGPDARFIAMHHRAGDWNSGFGVVNGEVDRRGGADEVLALLSCAHAVERWLGLPNTTRWYLASDSSAVVDAPQVQAWRDAGKLVARGPEPRTHLAAAGVVPPAGASGARGAAARGAGRPAPAWPPEGLLAAGASLAGVADAWADFLVLARATGAVVSSSAFGIMAAQIGAVSEAFYVNGCVRLDLVA